MDQTENTTVRVNLTPRTMAALEDAALFEGDTRTDTINRAIQLYCRLVAGRRLGERVFVGQAWRGAKELGWD